MVHSTNEMPPLGHGRCAIIHESSDGAERLRPVGPLDASNVAMFESAIVRSVRIGKTVIVDLGECPSIDDAVAATLDRAHRALDRRLRVRVVGGSALHVRLVDAYPALASSIVDA